MRLWRHIPLYETEELRGHTHQVLHVSFSHNGKYFASCSKDGYILLWDSGFPARIKHHSDMKLYSWKNTQYSEFNETDTLLLVSGVHFGSHSNTGGIAVFRITNDEFVLQCRMSNKPYDFFGTWYNDFYLLSCDLRWQAQLVSTSVVWLNRASQETQSEYTSIMNPMFKFNNRSASFIRSTTVANCLPTHDSSPPSPLSNPSPQVPVEDDQEEDQADPVKDDMDEEASVEESDPSSLQDDSGSSDDESQKVIDTRDKWLIFTMGTLTYTPHQIGLKRIKPFTFNRRIATGPNLRERVAIQRAAREAAEASIAAGDPIVEPMWLDDEAVPDGSDKIDHIIDLHGHIIGISLSPDHRYLYVNVRAWPPGCTIRNPMHPPPMAQEIDIHVIDLVTLQQVGSLLRAHRAYTPNDECFFIFLDVSSQYVASGAEDKHGYLWDRHYGVCLAQLPHSDVVNSVAFNPRNPEMLITASDDYTLKIWRSPALCRRMAIATQDIKSGVEHRRRALHRRSTVQSFALATPP